MHPRYRQLIDGGFTLLTANRALARHLLYRYAVHQTAAGKCSWETPDILPLGAWLERCWTQDNLAATEPRLLLSAAQARCVWERIIVESGQPPDPLQGASLAERVQQTWQVLHEWCQTTIPADGPLHQDARVYLSWAEGFARICLERGWIDSAAACLEHVRGLERAPHRKAVRIALAGFDEPSPLVLRLMDALQRSGATVERVELGPRNVRLAVCRSANPKAEALAAAAWARALLQQSPQSSIAVIAPDLAQRRALLEYAFEEVLIPGALPAASWERRPFSIALGRALAEQPMIVAALTALELAQGEIPARAAASLLYSPFIGDACAEGPFRSQIERRLRAAGEPFIDVQELQSMTAGAAGGAQRDAPLVGRLQELHARSVQLPRTQSPRQWAQAFGTLLKTLGWPGDRPLSSGEFQCLDSWHQVLATLAGLDVIERRLSLPAALSELRRLLAATQFQPESGDAGIRILGPDGAADAAFDALWFLGLDATAWPRRADPNPFIPLSLQRSLAMPGAAPELELRRAALMLERLCASATEVRLSYAERDQDRERRPSPLLRPWLTGGIAVAAQPPQRFSAQLQAAGSLQPFRDADAPALPQGWDGGGGVSLLRDQSACPFRACARHRLHASEIEEGDLGLDAAARGVLVHGVLQRIWSRIGDRAQLLRLAPGDIERLAADCADEVLKKFGARRPRTFTARFIALERHRLCALALRWLAFEREREPFQVLACEKPVDCKAGALALRGRIDRIDQLPDGRLLIIDYKTGRCSVLSFLGARPDEPQLPLYALNAGAPVAAVAYAAAGAGEPEFVGVAAEDGLLPGVRAVQALKRGAFGADWNELEHGWRATLDLLATEFLQGQSAVAPKSIQACRQCDLHMLCRIHEYGSTPDDADDEDA